MLGAAIMTNQLIERVGLESPAHLRYPRAFARNSRRNVSAQQRARLPRGLLFAAKRTFDVSVAGIGLILLAPVIAIVWLLVVTTSAGPALFWSERVGLHGRHFIMPKFRTLASGVAVAPREALHIGEQDFTPIGRWLRRLGLDELPQLLCVLKGDMSLIGPRPLLPNDPAALQRLMFPAALSVRPGITGLAQVSGRNAVTARRKARLDAFYARSFCFTGDLALLVKTFRVVLSGQGFR